MKNLAIFILLFLNVCFTQVIQVGSGSYTKSFPGTDAAGRNGYPSGQPQTTGPAAQKHVPTNDWWSYLIKNDHANNLFNYPLALKTVNSGLVTSYIPWGVFDDQEPIIVGLNGLVFQSFKFPAGTTSVCPAKHKFGPFPPLISA